MGVSCDLEVDVNGEGIFIVNKEIISSYSAKISKLIGKSIGQSLKVIFHDFPGGAESFELMTRFCYNNGNIEINVFNLSALYCVAHFMEMNKSASGAPNLLEKTEKSLEEIKYWTWSEFLVALKHCQALSPVANSSGILQKCVDSLVGRLALASQTSPCPSTSSTESFDTRSSAESLKNSSLRTTWWFEDLVSLNPNSVEIVTKSMVFKKFDHVIISRFLIYYQKSRFIISTSDHVKIKITETVVNMLYSLDQSAISCKSLFGILRAALSLNMSKCCRNKLESMIGSQMDQATLDSLLIPSSSRKNYLYDVNLVLRLLKSFIGGGGCRMPLARLKKVASLMDLYIAEVAPDPCLKPSKFLTLVRSLPNSSRDSHDALYHAIDMYIEVHAGLSEEEKLMVCFGLNYERLSSEACSHLARNENFPSKLAVQALISRQCKLKSLLEGTNWDKSSKDLPCRSVVDANAKCEKDNDSEQIVLYAGKLDLSAENEKLRANLQGMQWRVLELEKVCRKMQTQMTKVMKSRSSSHNNARSLPRLCS